MTDQVLAIHGNWAIATKMQKSVWQHIATWPDKIRAWLDQARQGSTWKECYGKAVKGSTR